MVRTQRWLTAVCAAAAATVLGLPAVSAVSAAPSGDSAPPVAMPAQMLEALQRDLGLSASEVADRLAAEERATRIEHAAVAELGAAFAGAWYGGGRLFVAVTDPAGAQRVAALGGVPVVVERSTAQLNAAKQRLDELAGAAAPAAVTSWYVDPASNSVVLTADSRRMDAAARAFVAAARELGVVRVVDSTESPRPAYYVIGGNAFFIRNVRCSIGFSVRTASGNKAFVTAGHCTEGGGTVSGGNGVFMGSGSGSVFGTGGDFGKVTVSSSAWDLRPWVNMWDGRYALVLGSQVASVGQQVCRSGSTSGWRCGEIKAKDVTVNYPGRTVRGLVRTSACAAPGDSGGSFMHVNQAQGMTSGITEACGGGAGTDSFYQPLREALNHWDLRLVTA